MEYAKLNGISLEYEVQGSGEPVLFIEPLLTGAFRPFFTGPEFAGGFQLIRYHKRGWGRSTHTPPPVTIEDYAEDAAVLLDFLDVDQVHVVGHSSGGAIAVQLALDNPQLVQSLVLLEPALMSVPSAPALLEKAKPAIDSFAAGDHESAIAYFLSAVSGLEWNSCKTTIETHAPRAIARTIADAETFFTIELPAVSEWKLSSKQAAEIVQPVLSVRGAETERMFSEVSEFLREWLPNLEEYMVEGAGHLLQLQQPHPISSRIAEFLHRHPIIVDDHASMYPTPTK